jgi:hypothetical protein
MDQLLAGSMDAEVRALREHPGLFDLLFEYVEALVSEPYDPQLRLTAAMADHMVSIGTLRLRKPSSCLIRAPVAVADDLPLFVLRGGPRAMNMRTKSETAGDRIPWVELRDRWRVDLFFHWVKHDLADHADLLLVDCDVSGEGFEAAGMLARAAADTLVMLSDYSNDQTAPAYHFLADLTGIDVGPKGQHPPSILPVPAGIEVAELELWERGREGFAFNFAKFLPNGSDVSLLRDYEITQAPPYYRLSNRLLILNAPDEGPSISVGPYERLADAILSTRERAVGPPSAEILSTWFADIPGRHNWDVFVSYSTDDQEAALHLRSQLVRSGLRAFVSRSDLAAQIGSSEWLSAIGRVLRRSRTLVALVSASAQKSKWVAQECRDFDSQVQDRGQGILIPICLPSSAPRELGSPLDRYQAIEAPNGLNDTIVAQLIELIRGALR